MRHSVITKNFSVGAFIMFCLLTLAGLIGWILNVVGLWNMTASGQEILFAFRILGILIPPVGAVVGYL